LKRNFPFYKLAVILIGETQSKGIEGKNKYKKCCLLLSVNEMWLKNSLR